MLYRPNHRCSIRNCHELAIYGDKKPTHCETHKTESEHSFLISTCKSCHFQAIIVDNEGYCFFCNPETIKSVRLAKQKKVSDFLGRHFELESIDTIIDSSCGRERPDIVLNPESGFFKIVVEVDEYQHKGRPQFCACQRMVNVGEIFQMPTLFIRYNPDEYKTTDLEEISERKRLSNLKEIIKKYIKTETIPALCCMIQLFYDGYSVNQPLEVTTIR